MISNTSSQHYDANPLPNRVICKYVNITRVDFGPSGGFGLLNNCGVGNVDDGGCLCWLGW